MKILRSMSNPRHFGPIVSLCMDHNRTWVVAASSTGVLALWDLRFGILLRTWNVGGSTSRRSWRIRQCILHPSRGRGRWIIVALEDVAEKSDDVVLLEVWDLERSALVEWYIMRDDSSITNADVIKKPQDWTVAECNGSTITNTLLQSSRSHYDILRSRNSVTIPSVESAHVKPSHSINAIAVAVSFSGQSGILRPFANLSVDVDQGIRPSKAGFLITGSEDRMIKLLDLEKYERSTILSDGGDATDRTIFRYDRLLLVPGQLHDVFPQHHTM